MSMFVKRYSNCCGALPDGELYEGEDEHFIPLYTGRCSRCMDGAAFYSVEELEEQDERSELNILRQIAETANILLNLGSFSSIEDAVRTELQDLITEYKSHVLIKETLKKESQS